MSRHVSDERLDIIFTQVQGAFRRGSTNDVRTRARVGYVDPILVTVDARHLSPLLDELRSRRRQTGAHPAGNFNLSNVTRVLMLMKIGEVVEIEPITHAALTSIRRTARKRLNNPYATWHRVTLDSGLVQITRMPDGTPAAAKYSLPIVSLLANMRVGEFRDVPASTGRAYHHDQKVAAQKLMDNAGAQWKSVRISKTQFRVKRIR